MQKDADYGTINKQKEEDGAIVKIIDIIEMNNKSMVTLILR